MSPHPNVDTDVGLWLERCAPVSDSCTLRVHALHRHASSLLPKKGPSNKSAACGHFKPHMRPVPLGGLMTPACCTALSSRGDDGKQCTPDPRTKAAVWSSCGASCPLAACCRLCPLTACCQLCPYPR